MEFAACWNFLRPHTQIPQPQLQLEYAFLTITFQNVSFWCCLYSIFHFYSSFSSLTKLAWLKWCFSNPRLTICTISIILIVMVVMAWCRACFCQALMGHFQLQLLLFSCWALSSHSILDYVSKLMWHEKSSGIARKSSRPFFKKSTLKEKWGNKVPAVRLIEWF